MINKIFVYFVLRFNLYIDKKMQSIMEENKIVQTITTLLYSRTYQKLFIQIFDNQTKNLISKHQIDTSKYVEINVGMPLRQMQIMVKVNQQNVQILNEFKFCFEDFSSNSTVEKLENYVKLRKKFQQYSLLFQIFYRFNSNSDSAEQPRSLQSAQNVRLSGSDKQKQYENQMRQIARTNLFFLQHRVLSKYAKYQSKKKTYFPTEQSLLQKSRGIKRKDKRFLTDNQQSLNSGKSDKKKSNFQTCYKKRTDRIKSQKQQNHSKMLALDQSSYHNGGFEQTSFQPFFLRNNKKNVTYEESKSELFSKRRQLKKNTFLDDKASVKDKCQDNISDTKNTRADSMRKQETEDHYKDVSTYADKMATNKTEQIQLLQLSQILNQQLYKKTEPSTQQRCNTIQPQNEYENLRILCKQKQCQRVKLQKKRFHPNSNKNNYIYNNTRKYFGEKSNKLQFNQQSPNCASLNRNNSSLLSRNHSLNNIFYSKLYEKTKKSIERQSKILNYVKNNCQANIFKKLKFQKSSLTQERNKQKQNSLAFKVSYKTQQIQTFKLQRSKPQEKFLWKIKNASKLKQALRN